MVPAADRSIVGIHGRPEKRVARSSRAADAVLSLAADHRYDGRFAGLDRECRLVQREQRRLPTNRMITRGDIGPADAVAHFSERIRIRP